MTKHIIIIGAGLAGLCLGQGLKKAGISFSIFERDLSRNVRAQGYRLRINPMGAEALERCLSEESWNLFVKTCANTQAKFVNLNMITAVEAPAPLGRTPPSEDGRSYFADRNTMRACFMIGIESSIHFGKTFKSYQTLQSGKVRVEFEDGTLEDGDLLVGADGRGSRVRAQYLPENSPFDLRGRAIYGKTPFTAEFATKYAPECHDRFGIGFDPTMGLRLFGQVIRFDEDPAITSNGRLDSVQDYVYWVLLGKEANFRVPNQNLLSLSKSELKDLTLELAKAWHPSIRCVLEDQSIENISALIVSSAMPTPWQSSSNQITVLGDAIHAMLPLGGQGANIALNDARYLCETIVRSGDGPIAITEFEEKMREYSFKAVEEAYTAAKNHNLIESFEEAKERANHS